jgi:hypothetical protein
MKLLYLFLFAVLLFAGCGPDRSKEEQAIKDVINKNIAAGNDEDVNAYMETIDKDNKNYDRMQDMMNTIYSTYDLNYQVRDVKLLELKDNEAKVQLVQVIKKIKGPEFRDKKVTVIDTMHKTNGEWKIYDIQITKTEYLQ